MTHAFALPTTLPHHPNLSLPLRIPPNPHTCTASLIAVVGATGGVGRLAITRLLSTIPPTTTNPPISTLHPTRIRAIVRDVSRARALLPLNNPHLHTLHLPSTATASPPHLRAALLGVASLIICTGTTAFPTRAWKSANTPSAVDDVGVRNLLAAVDTHSIRRVVYISSIGTTRPKQFPFSILNAFGAVDAKRSGELHVMQAARAGGFAYAIIRPGRLVGEPHSNSGMVRKDPHPGRLDVRVEKDDCLNGDLSRQAVARLAVSAATWDCRVDLQMSVVHCDGLVEPSERKWHRLMAIGEVEKGKRLD